MNRKASRNTATLGGEFSELWNFSSRCPLTIKLRSLDSRYKTYKRLGINEFLDFAIVCYSNKHNVSEAEYLPVLR
jgi:hypothetical protein